MAKTVKTEAEIFKEEFKKKSVMKLRCFTEKLWKKCQTDISL